MQIQKQIRVIFLQAKENGEKVRHLCQQAQSHLAKKHKLIFYSNSQKALEYIDNLLWSTPSLGFIPHEITHSESTHLIILTSSLANLNGSSAIFNLSNEPITSPDPMISTIYELDDATTAEKKTISQKKFEVYKQERFHLMTQ